MARGLLFTRVDGPRKLYRFMGLIQPAHFEFPDSPLAITGRNCQSQPHAASQVGQGAHGLGSWLWPLQVRGQPCGIRFQSFFLNSDFRALRHLQLFMAFAAVEISWPAT